MKINKVKKQLKKINLLFSSIEEEGSISSIEKDLLKSYVQDLYSKIIEKDLVSDVPPKKNEKKYKKKSDRPHREKKVEANLSSTHPAAAIKENPGESIFNDEVTSTSASSGEEVLESIVKKELHTTPNGTAQATKTQVQTSTVIELGEKEDDGLPEDEQLEILFSSENVSDLSGKLSNMPIKDLNAAFGLNEKIFTINELFGGNHGLYQEVINELNGLNSFDDARRYLTNNVVYEQSWTSDHKVKKAVNFIKSIRRRYL